MAIFYQLKPPFLILCIAAIVSACGGSSGGSSSSQAVNDQDTSVVDIDNVPVNAAGCAVDLGEYLRDNNRTVPGGLLEKLSDQCSYRVSSNVQISGDVSIAAGVTFALDPGVDIEFRNGDVNLAGTAQAPIRFTAAQAGGHWGKVEFSNKNVIIDYTLFNEGGAGSVSNSAVNIDASESDISITNTVVSDSLGNGLLLGGYQSKLSMFSNNVMRGNAGFGLVLGSWSVASGLSAANDFQGKEASNGKMGVSVGSYGGSGVRIRDIGVPYHVEEGEVRNLGFSLTGSLVEAGVEIRFPDNVKFKTTSSTFNGTANLPVILTSATGDASSVWGGITVDDRSSVLRHVRIENAGGGEASAGGALASGRYNDFDDVTIENITIVNSQSWGVFCDSISQVEPATIEGLAVEGSVAGDIHPSCQLSAESDSSSDGVRFDISTCAQTLLAGNVDSSAPYTFYNTDAACDYLVSGDVRLNSTALLEPGVTLVFTRGASIDVQGTLTALGTAQLPITLKAEVADDGYWDGLRVGGAASRLLYVEIEDGGNIEGAGFTAYDGIADGRVNSDVVLENLTVSGSMGDGALVSDDVDVNAFSDNTFIGNAGVGLKFHVSQLDKLDASTLYNSALAPNGMEGVRLYSTSNNGAVYLGRSETMTLEDIGEPFRFSTLRLVGESTLMVTSGVDLLFDSQGQLDISGDSSVQLTGTADRPIALRLASDQTQGWAGVAISQSSFVASNVSIKNAGAAESGEFRTTQPAALTLGSSSTTATLTNVNISDSSGWAIDCFNTTPSNFTFSNVSYADNALGNTNPRCGS